jgi:Protein of unknown function (DUF1236)
MTNRFMISVAAAALIAGTGFANAQGMGQKEAPAAAQQSAPAAEHATPAAPAGHQAAEPKAAPSPGMKATQSEQKAPGAANTQRAEDNAQGQKPGNMRPENNNAQNNNAPGKDMKAEGRDNNVKTEGRENNDMKAEGRDNRDGNKNAETKTPTDSKSQTTGQAGAGGKLSGEQRTKITTVIRGQHIAPVTHVNFAISVGTRVPRDVSFHPLPPEVITYYPEWRGYEFILVNNQILVIDPQTYEIVAVLDA